jgi:hypothetical protein
VFSVFSFRRDIGMATSSAALLLRAGHHFPHATAFIEVVREAFEAEGFEVWLGRSTMRFRRNGHRYVVDLSRRGGHQTASIRRHGGTAPIVAADFTELQDRLRHARTTADYDAVKNPVRDAARALRRDADGVS